MQVSRETVTATTVTVKMSEQEARDIAYVISEALWGLSQPQQDGCPFNWKGDPGVLRDLHNQVRPAEWGDLA